MDEEDTKVLIKQVNDRLSFDFENGIVIWKINTGGRFLKGKIAGAKRKDGYWTISILATRYLLHRVIWLMYHGKWTDNEIDHIDGNPSNNKISNLREATSSQNGYNIGLKNNNTSGIIGVHFCKNRGKWVAQICVENKHVYLGRFLHLKDAVRARQNAVKKYHREFTRSIT